MTEVMTPALLPFDAEALVSLAGRIVVLVDGDAPTSPGARRVDKLTRGALRRLMASDAWGHVKPGEAVELAYPTGLAADGVQVVRLARKADLAAAR